MLAKGISREKVNMDFEARLKYLLPPRFQGIGVGLWGGGDMMHEYKSALRGWVDSEIA